MKRRKGNERRFLKNCLQMQANHPGEKSSGRYWSSESYQMIEQLKAYPPPKYPIISSKHYFLGTFGGAVFKPDSYYEYHVLFRVLRKLQIVVRKYFGYGKLTNLIPFLAWGETFHHFLKCSKVNYDNAVSTGYLLLRDSIEKHNINTPNVYAEQCVLLEGGRRLGWETLVALKKALVIGDMIGEVDTILEIGAGSGELARLMLHMGIAQRCIIVDIPPALAVSQEVLLSHFGESEIGCFFPERTDIDDVSHKKCVFLLPSQINLIKKANVGINTASFQEMTQEIVKSYIELSKSIGLSDFISINTRQSHAANVEQELTEDFYEKSFSPEFRVSSRYSWDKSLDIKLKSHNDSYTGYQLLHFIRE